MFLEFKNVSVGYDTPLIENINTSLKLGDICLMIGSNGVGKTTLIRSIFNQIRLLNGNILIEGRENTSLEEKEIAMKISGVFSKSLIPDNYTTRELISLGKFIYYPYYFELNKKDKKQVEEVIKKFRLEQYADISIRNLSDGNLQKVFIARAFVQDSPMIILDEPTTYLDEENKNEVLKLLRILAKEYQKLILFSSHDWRFAKNFVDKIWFIKNKKLHSGLAEDIIYQFNLLSINSLERTDFISPKIEAPTDEKKLLITLLRKNFNIDLSSFYFKFTGNHWIISLNGKEIKQAHLFESILKVVKENVF